MSRPRLQELTQRVCAGIVSGTDIGRTIPVGRNPAAVAVTWAGAWGVVWARGYRYGLNGCHRRDCVMVVIRGGSTTATALSALPSLRP